MPQIDKATYNKAAKHQPGHGYEARTAAPSSIIVHSTSNPNQKNTAFESEAKFLLDAPLVGAHYLVGKDGRIVEFLDPRRWAAWHAGNTKVAFLNQRSIGIELHHSVGDPPYPSAQLGALADLIVSLCAEYNIPFGLVDTHGQVAIKGPYQRKTDPSDWRYQDFLTFRSHLSSPLVRTVKAGPRGAIAQQDRKPGAPTAGLWYPPGSWIQVDDLTADYWHAQDGTGFIPRGQVEE